MTATIEPHPVFTKKALSNMASSACNICNRNVNFLEFQVPAGAKQTLARHARPRLTLEEERPKCRYKRHAASSRPHPQPAHRVMLVYKLSRRHSLPGLLILWDPSM